MSKNKFIGAMLWGQVGRISEMGLSLLFTILVVRQLTEENFGSYTTFTNLLNLLGMSLGLGLSSGLLRFVPIARAEKPQASFWLLRRVMLVSLITTICQMLILLLGNQLLAVWLKQPLLLTDIWPLAALLFLYDFGDILLNFFYSMLWVGRVTLIRLVGQLSNIILVVIWFSLASPAVTELIFCLVIVNLGMVSAELVLLFRLGLFQPFNPTPELRNKLRPMVTYCRDLWVIGLANIGLMGQVDVLIIALVATNPAEVSYYSLAALLISRLYALITAWAASLGSIVSTVQLEKGRDGLERYFTYYYRFSLPLHLILMVALGVIAQPLVLLVFGQRYQPIILLLYLFILQNIIGAFLGASICSSFINTLGRQKIALRWRWGFSLLNIGLDFVLVPLWGALGAVVATGVANILVQLAEALLVRDLYAKINFIYPLKIGLGILSGGVLCLFIGESGLLISVIRGAVFGLYLFFFFIVVKPIEASDRQLLLNLRPGLARFITPFSLKPPAL